MVFSRAGLFLILFFLWVQPLLRAQSGTSDPVDPSSIVGLSLTELFQRFGAPQSVYAVRGPEEWQDDVVFVYGQGDFYIYKDRVWQAGLKAGRGIKLGDSYGTVAMILGSGAQTQGSSIFYSLDERSWPLMLRCDFDGSGKVQAIFIYRADF